LRVIDHYGEKEQPAFEQFKTFTIPRGYHWQEDTAAARFVLALRSDSDLREMYARDPLAAVSDARFHDLSERERAMLSTRNAGAVQLAAKGVSRATPSADTQETQAALQQSSDAPGTGWSSGGAFPWACPLRS
jgi:hypothetical protein